MSILEFNCGISLAISRKCGNDSAISGVGISERSLGIELHSITDDISRHSVLVNGLTIKLFAHLPRITVFPAQDARVY